MAKIPFDIKYRPQIESGEYKVETQDGRPARIVCWDRQNTDFPLIVLILSDGDEGCDVYTINGKFYCNQKSDYDLIIITQEPELTEFEKALGEEIFDSPFNAEQIKVIKEESAKFLKLAREGYVPREEKWSEVEKTAKVEFLRGEDFGREAVLKDLPRWKKCGENTLRSYGDEHFEYRKDGCYVVIRGREILLSDLEKLPEEE